jgi:hypothetical protein
MKFSKTRLWDKKNELKKILIWLDLKALINSIKYSNFRALN